MSWPAPRTSHVTASRRSRLVVPRVAHDAGRGAEPEGWVNGVAAPLVVYTLEGRCCCTRSAGLGSRCAGFQCTMRGGWDKASERPRFAGQLTSHAGWCPNSCCSPHYSCTHVMCGKGASRVHGGGLYTHTMVARPETAGSGAAGAPWGAQSASLWQPPPPSSKSSKSSKSPRLSLQLVSARQ